MRVPLAKSSRFATRLVTAREYLLVWIDTADGTTGSGHAYAGTAGGRILRDLVLELCRPRLLGADCARIEELWTELYRETLLLGRRGAVLRVLSAIDIALWDVQGIAQRKPLYRLLGATRNEVSAYASGGYYRDGDPLEDVRREMARNVERGFDAAKIKVGLDADLDVERVRVARETLGPHRKLALDANNAWHEAKDAIAFARRIERYDPWWLEEPLSPDDVLGHAKIAAALELPVATGEIHATRWDFRELIAARAADILQPDASVLGGISEWQVVAREAAAAGLPVAPHWDANLHVHLAAASANCLVVEHFALDLDIYNFERLIVPEARLVPHGGRLRAPERPGVGIVLDPDAIQRWRLA